MENTGLREKNQADVVTNGLDLGGESVRILVFLPYTRE